MSNLSRTLAAVGVLLCHLPARAQAPSPLDQIGALTSGSTCAAIRWSHNRGRAPNAYLRGMAIMYARAVCESMRPDVRIVSSAKAGGDQALRTDALAWYDAQFNALGMSNATDGLDTLRHSYALLLSLGMQESSGRYCLGRDRSANFNSADSAEAGLFQTSWGANTRSPVLAELFGRYSADQSGCLLDVFRQNIRCGDWDARTWGEGKGAEWQKLTKACPAFATEYAAVLIRLSGGSRGEFGPLRRRHAELRRECDAMFAQVQALVQSNPLMCAALR
jgi:hypothetical protein